ncbi:hypothetical protein DPMN_053829 [Dreissena polymorpha]|uniref:Uncharacterized protein n=1 Tax=Dreissena polymorpha TaxID=45954 RepID=A0A9D4CP54_DREPO|nr:hypothetical protein DPMN_053829 [Dreissena polymorpha]
MEHQGPGAIVGNKGKGSHYLLYHLDQVSRRDDKIALIIGCKRIVYVYLDNCAINATANCIRNIHVVTYSALNVDQGDNGNILFQYVQFGPRAAEEQSKSVIHTVKHREHPRRRQGLIGACKG